MKLKLGIIGYLPPPQFGCSKVFLENLSKNRPGADLLLYSDHDYGKPDWFKFIRLRVNPEEFKKPQYQPAGIRNEWGMNNAIWVTGMHFAVLEGYTHVIYIESDCRFGEPVWDLPMWEETFGAGHPVAAAGSLVCWNPHLGGMEGMKRWEALIVGNANRGKLPVPASVQTGQVKRENFPIPTYGVGQRPVPGHNCPAVFPNGALGVYDMAWVTKLFDVTNTMEMVKSQAWDFALGERLWQAMGLHSYDVVRHLDCVYSSYGDVLTTEDWRLQLLKDHRVVGCHQVKSQATI
jgi:hypothetical protein